MDSKLKWITILSAVLTVSLIVGTVVGIHFWQEEKQAGKAEAIAGLREVGEKKSGIDYSVDNPEIDYGLFMGDETFFDKDPTQYEQMIASTGKKLTLAAVSVEKDLRVQVLNELGELVSGKELYITVNGEEYKDLDRDGVIYVGDLKPGEYEVALREAEEYKVPSSPLKIHVKEKVEYVPIDDISLLIRTEADIDAEREDTGENGAKEDADGTERTDVSQPEGNKSFGIDVSKWNKEIDWEKVKAQGVEFAIIRCGYRGSSTGSLVEDPYFRKNIEGARRAGIKTGLYFFTQATSVVEAVEEASMVLCLNNGMPLDYPVFIDTEGAGGNGRADHLDVETRTKVCDAFCQTISGAGYSAGIYASRNWYNNRLDMTKLDDRTIWLAEYRDQPAYTGKYQLWQYTSNGTLDGIEGRVDFNISYGNE